MIDFNSLVINEPIFDVAASLVGSSGEGLSYITLDRLYSRFKPEVHQTGEFRSAIRLLIDLQVLTMSKQMKLTRGINWKMPQCRKDKKYGFE